MVFCVLMVAYGIRVLKMKMCGLQCNEVPEALWHQQCRPAASGMRLLGYGLLSDSDFLHIRHLCGVVGAC